MNLQDKTLHNIPFQISPQLDSLGIKHGFTTRNGGVSTGAAASLNLGIRLEDKKDNILKNYELVLNALEVQPDRIAFSHQIHSNKVRVILEEDIRKNPYDPAEFGVDGLVTNLPGVTLITYSADCNTIIFYDPVKKVIANVHSGWRGTVGKIAENAILAMTESFGSTPSDIKVAIGPCISKCCFETSQDVRDEFFKVFGDEAIPLITDKHNGKYMIDIKGFNQLIVKNAGVLPENIDVSLDCTMCNQNKYWSHRAMGLNRGSLAALICL